MANLVGIQRTARHGRTEERLAGHVFRDRQAEHAEHGRRQVEGRGVHPLALPHAGAGGYEEAVLPVPLRSSGCHVGIVGGTDSTVKKPWSDTTMTVVLESALARSWPRSSSA